jgi:hypothetical protein
VLKPRIPADGVNRKIPQFLHLARDEFKQDTRHKNVVKVIIKCIRKGI